MSSSSDDPFRPPSDDERGGRPSGEQSGEQSGWGWGQQPQDPARASWEAGQQPPPNPQGQPQQAWWDQSGSAQQGAGGQQGQPGAGYGTPGAYGQPDAYGPPSGGHAGYGGYAPPAPDHPRSTTALVVGLISLIGGLMCVLPILASPFALFIGRKAVKEIDAEPGRYGGRGSAMAGYVMGIIGTVLLVLGLLGVVLFIVAIATAGFA